MHKDWRNNLDKAAEVCPIVHTEVREATSASAVDDQEEDVVFERFILHSSKIFLGIFLTLSAVGVGSIYVESSEWQVWLFQILLVACCFVVPPFFVFSRFRCKVRKGKLHGNEARLAELRESKILLAIFSSTQWVQIGIVPIYFDNGFVLGCLLVSIIFGSFFFVLAHLLWSTKATYWSRQASAFASIFFVVTTAVPFSVLLSAACVSDFDKSFENYSKMTLYMSGLVGSMSFICWIVSTRTRMDSLLTNNQVIIRYLRLGVMHTMIIIPLGISIPLLVFEGGNFHSLLQTFVMVFVSGIIFLAGFALMDNNVYRAHLTRNQRWVYFALFVGSMILSELFLMPLQILDPIQQSANYGIVGVLTLTLVLLCLWSLLLTIKLHARHIHALSMDTTRLPTEETMAKPPHTADVENERSQPRKLKTVMNVPTGTKEYLINVWLAPTLVYTVMIVSTFPTFAITSISLSFATETNISRSTQAALYFTFMTGGLHLLWQWLYFNGKRWLDGSYTRRAIETFAIHAGLILPCASISFYSFSRSVLLRNTLIVASVLAMEVLLWSVFFLDQVRMWRYSNIERGGSSLIYVCFCAWTLPCIVIHWINQEVDGVGFPDTLSNVFHFCFVLGASWLLMYFLYTRRWFKRRTVWVKMTCYFLLTGCVCIPLSLFYLYRHSTASLGILSSVALASFHTAAILLSVDVFWKKGYFCLEFTFIVIYVLLVVIPVSAVPAILSDERTTSRLISVVAFGALLSLWILLNLTEAMRNLHYGRRCLLSFIFTALMDVPLTIYLFTGMYGEPIVGVVSFGVQLILWERLDEAMIVPWQVPFRGRLLISIAWSVLVACPLSLILVYTVFYQGLFNVAASLLAVVLFGGGSIAYAGCYWHFLRHYEQPITAGMPLCIFTLSHWMLYFAILRRLANEAEFQLELLLLVVHPIYLLWHLLMGQWKIRTVDKFILCSLFGVILPLISFLKSSAAMTRTNMYLMYAVPGFSLAGVMLPSAAHLDGITYIDALSAFSVGIVFPFGVLLPIYMAEAEQTLALVAIVFLPVSTSVFLGARKRYNTPHTTERFDFATKKKWSIARVWCPLKSMEWTKHWFALFSLVALVTTEHFVATEARKAPLYMIFFFTPMLYFLKSNASAWAILQTKTLWAVLFLFLMCCVVLAKYFYDVNDAVSFALCIALLFVVPGIIISAALVHVFKECMRAHPEKDNVIALGSTFCCVGILVPFGVVLPSMLATDWDLNVFYANALLMGMSFLALICLVDVSTLTIAINSTFQTIQKEKSAKAASQRISDHMNEHKLKLDPSVARALYDQAILAKAKAWDEFETKFRKEEVVVRIQVKNVLAIIDYDELTDGLRRKSICLCKICRKSGWRVLIPRTRNKLCKACTMQSLLDKKKKIEEDIAATAAVKALRKQEAKEQAKKIQEARFLREKKFKAILELTSKKLYRKALVALNEILEEDKENPDFVCHRSILLLQLHRGYDALADAEESLSLRPKFVNGIAAKGAALSYLHRWKDAVEVLRTGVALFPKHLGLRESLKIASMKIEIAADRKTFFDSLSSCTTSLLRTCERVEDEIEDQAITTMHKISNTVHRGNRRRFISTANPTEKLYHGCNFQIRVVDLEGMQKVASNYSNVTSIKCELRLAHNVKKLNRHMLLVDAKAKSFCKRTHALFDFNELVWSHEMVHVPHWLLKGRQLVCTIIGTEEGKLVVLGKRKLYAFEVAMMCRRNAYVHFELMEAPALRLGIAFSLTEPFTAAQMLYLERQIDTLRNVFFQWRRVSVPRKAINIRVLKEIFLSYSSFNPHKRSEKRRANQQVVRQISFRSELARLKKKAAEQMQNDSGENHQSNDESVDEVNVLRRSDTKVFELKMSRPQFEKFVDDAMLDHVYPNTVFLSVVGSKKRGFNTAAWTISFPQFCEIIKKLVKRMYPTIAALNGMTLFVEDHIHKVLPLYSRWRKIHIIRLGGNSFKDTDPRKVSLGLALQTQAAIIIQKDWRAYVRRLRACRFMQRWYKRRVRRLEREPHRRLNQHLLELLHDDSMDGMSFNSNHQEDAVSESGFLKIVSKMTRLLYGSAGVKPVEIVDQKSTQKEEEREMDVGIVCAETEPAVSEEERVYAAIKKTNDCRQLWPTIHDQLAPALMQELNKHVESFRQKGVDEIVVVDWKIWDNVLAFHVGIVITLYQYVSVALAFSPLEESIQDVSKAFEEDLPWRNSIKVAMSVPQFKIPGSEQAFHIFFWISVAIALTYPFYAIKAIRALKENRLGLDASGKKITKCFSPDGIYNFVLNAVNDYLYFGMMFVLISVFACRIDEFQNVSTDTNGTHNVKYILMADVIYDKNMTGYVHAPMECFAFSQPTHLVYMAASTVALLSFYPLATLLAPNFQFNNKALDVKFDQTFLIMEHQAELMMAGFSIFYQDSWRAVLIPQLCICLCLSGFNYRLQPCLVQSLNKFRTATYLCAAHSCVSSILFQSLKEAESASSDRNGIALICWSVLIGGWVVIMLSTLFIHKRDNKCNTKVSPLLDIKVDPVGTQQS